MHFKPEVLSISVGWLIGPGMEDISVVQYNPQWWQCFSIEAENDKLFGEPIPPTPGKPTIKFK